MKNCLTEAPKTINQQCRRSHKGLLLIMNLVNFLNTFLPLSPYYTLGDSLFAVKEDQRSQTCEHTTLSYIYYLFCEMDWADYLKFYTNLLMTSLVFCFSLYLLIGNRSISFRSNEGPRCLFYLIGFHIMMGFAAHGYPNIFLFHYLINATIFLNLYVKQVEDKFNLRSLLIGVLSFISNFLVLQSVKQKVFLQQEQIDFASLTLTYLLGYLIYALHVTQEKLLNLNMLQMFVDQINSMEKSLEIKDNYNASMIHELRNPLNAVLGSIGLLKYSQNLSKEDLETLNIASVSGEILITLINNALDGAKIEANKLELDPRMNDIVEILTKSVSLYHWKSKEKNIDISLKIGKNIPDQVEIDDARLTQILVNLIGNAVKFTSEKGKVKVRAKFVSENDCQDELLQYSSQKRQDFTSDFLDDNEDQDEYEEKIIDKQDLPPTEERHHENHFDTQNNQNMATSSLEEKLRCNSDNSFRNQQRQESYTSLTNVGSLEERAVESKLRILDRDFTMKNSFNEWSHLVQQHNEYDSRIPFIPTFQNLKEIQESCQSVKNQVKKYSGELYVKKNTQLKRSNPLKAAKYSMYRHDSEAFSESLHRNNSLSIDSYLQEKAVSRTNTSSCSNNFLMDPNKKLLNQKKKIGMSTFYKDQNSIDDENDDEENSRGEEQSNNMSNSQAKISSQNVNPIEMENRKQKSAKGTLIIEVIDSGIGMTAEAQKKLFQPFSQADKSIQAKYGGTGLGLWITHKLIVLMNGKVKVKSELNRGTAFIIEIPVQAEFNIMSSSELLVADSSPMNGIKSFDDIMSRGPQYQYSKEYLNQLKEQIMRNNNSQIKVLLFQNDEINKNLFIKFLQKHKLQFTQTTKFKKFMSLYKTKEYRACFIDIDVNVRTDDLEKFVEQLNKFSNSQSVEGYQRYKVYCLYSREINKTKNKILTSDHIQCLKKPLQGYHLSKILRKIKNMDFEMQLMTLKTKSSSLNEKIQNDNLKRRSIPVYPLDSNNFPLNTNYTQGVKRSNESSNSLLNSTSQLGIQNNTTQIEGYPNSNKHQVLYQSRFNKRQDQFDDDEEEKVDHNTLQFKNMVPNSLTSSSSQADSNMDRQKKLMMMAANQFSFSGQSYKNFMQRYQEQGYDSDRKNQMIKVNQSSPQQQQILKTSPNHQQEQSEFNIMISKRQTNERKNFSHSYNIKINNQDERQDLNDDEEEKKSSKKSSQTQYTPQFNLSVFTSSRVNSELNQNSIEQTSQSQVDNIRVTSNQQSFGMNSNKSEQNQKYQSQFLRNGGTPSGAVAAVEFNPFTIHKSEGSVQFAVLIVDDNIMNQFIVQKMLEKEKTVAKFKIELIVANNGLEAFQKYQEYQQKGSSMNMENKIKLILMDCEMPEMDGYEASKKIREFESNMDEDQKVLIIGLSGNSGEQHTRKCKLAGMNEAFTKPIAFEQLTLIVNRAFNPYLKRGLSQTNKF